MLRERWLMQSKKPLLLLSIQSSLRYHLPKDHRQVVCRQKDSRGQVKLCQIQTERRSRSVGMDQMATPKETETIIMMARCLSRMTTSGKMVKDRQAIFPPDPSYNINWEPVIGVGLVLVCAVGIMAVAADDVIGVGVADDFLFGPLGAGVSEGLIMIFG